MSNKVYVLQVSDGEDPKLLSKIITTGHGGGGSDFGEDQRGLCQKNVVGERCSTRHVIYLLSSEKKHY